MAVVYMWPCLWLFLRWRCLGVVKNSAHFLFSWRSPRQLRFLEIVRLDKEWVQCLMKFVFRKVTHINTCYDLGNQCPEYVENVFSHCSQNYTFWCSLKLQLLKKLPIEFFTQDSSSSGNPNCCFMIIAVTFFYFQLIAEGNCELPCLSPLVCAKEFMYF